MEPRFKKQPRPDNEVIEALEQALEAARSGHVRTVLLVTVNPLHQHEIAARGNLEGVGRTILIGALSAAAHELLKIT